MTTRTRLLSLFVLLVFAAVPAFAADTVIDGQTGPSSFYRLIRPEVWNGRLVVYAHGTVISGPVALPPEADLVASLLTPNGFAVAFSSFSEIGWAVKDGAQRTHQLLGLFTSKFGKPVRTYVAGASLGGLIAIDLTETYRTQYDGGLALCSVAGGSLAQFDYLGHVRALFDFFYPNVLPGSAGEVDPNIDIDLAIVQPAIVAMTLNPAGALAIAAIQQTPVPFANPVELGQSIVTALADHALSYRDIPLRTHGHPFFDNRQTVYTGALPPAVLQAVNLGVERFDASPSALNYLKNNTTPTGDLRNPLLMMRTSRDPVVPGFHDALYALRVASEGSSDLLVQRTVNRYGHCNFLPGELIAAFGDLVTWVELGVKP